MADYPEWVLKYKTKGYYVNKYKDHYRLYKGHCEYKNGKYVRVVDYYCGTITEKDGFVPSSGLVKGDIVVFQYGFYYFLYLLFYNIYKGQITMHKKYADTIMVLAICNTFNVSEYNLEYTALPLIYSKYNSKYSSVDLVISEANRVSVMIKNEFTNKCCDIANLKDILSTLSIIYINKRFYLSNCDEKVYEIYKLFGFEVKIYGKN